MFNDAEDQTVRLCIPNDVQFTIIGAQDDRLKVKFDQSKHYEKRLGPGSARANEYASHFFCFDYLGDDSIRADMLSPKENYRGLDVEEAEIIIDISRRTSAFNSASKQLRQTDLHQFNSIQPTDHQDIDVEYYSNNHHSTRTPNNLFEKQTFRRKSQDGLQGIQNPESQLEHRRADAATPNETAVQPQIQANTKRDRVDHQPTMPNKVKEDIKTETRHIAAAEKQNKTANIHNRPSSGSITSSDKHQLARDSLEIARGPHIEASIPSPVPIMQARNVVSENNVTSKVSDNKIHQAQKQAQDYQKPKSEIDQQKSVHRSIDPRSELSATDYKLSQEENPFDKRKSSQKTSGPPKLPKHQQKRTDSGIPLSSACSDVSPKSENTREKRQLLLNNLSYLEQEIKKIQGQGRLTSEEEGYLHQMYHKLNDVKERLSLLDPGLDPFRKTLGDRATIESGFRRRNLGQAEAYNPDNLSSDYKKHKTQEQSPVRLATSTSKQSQELKKPSSSFVEGNGKLEKEHFIFKKKLTQLTNLSSKPQANPKRLSPIKDSPRSHQIPPPISKTTKNTDRTNTQSKTGITKTKREQPDLICRTHTDIRKPLQPDTDSMEDDLALRRKSLARSKHHKLPA